MLVVALLARHVSERAAGAPVRIGVLLGSGERHGAAAGGWTVDGLGREHGSWTTDFPQPYGRRTVHRFPFSDQHTLGLPDVRTGPALDARAATAMLGPANRPAVAGFLRRPAVRGLTDLVFGGLHLGGDGFAVIAEAGKVRAGFTGRRQSRATGLVAAHVVRRLPGLPHGVAHLETLVDPEEFLTPHRRRIRCDDGDKVGVIGSRPRAPFGAGCRTARETNQASAGTPGTDLA